MANKSFTKTSGSKWAGKKVETTTIDSNGNKVITNSHSVGIKNILAIVLCILLLATLLRTLTSSNSNPPTFTSFLEMLTNVPEASIPFMDFSQSVLGDWGAFNFLRDFVSILLQICNVVIFFVNGIINIVLYVVYFFKWLFVF